MINVVIADHEAIFRAGIAKVLAVEEDIRIVGQPQSGEQLLNALEKLRVRVLILSSSFIPLLADIQEIANARNTALLMLVENTETASDFMGMGMQGAIYRSASGNVVVEAVRRLSRGESFMQSPGGIWDGEISEDLVGARVRNRLSERELRIISAVVQGCKNRDIAMQLYTSEQMVKNALRNIFDKIGVSDRLELALFTIHHRILAQATASVRAVPAQRRNAQNGDKRPMATIPPPTAIN